MSAPDIDDVPSNPSASARIQEIIAQRIARRSVLKGLAATAAVSAVGIEAAAQSSPGLAHGIDGTHHVAPGYKMDVVVRWGDPIQEGAPAFDATRLTAEAQATQWGYNNDFLAFMPLPKGSQNSGHGLLFANHEYTNAELMWSGIADYPDKFEKLTKEQAAVEKAAHGLSVVEIRRENGRWRPVMNGGLNRRFTADTPMRLAGPVAGHARVKTSADPEGKTALGTLNNCAGGVTPWGTCLTGEENVNGYFGGDPAKTREAGNLRRYGFTPRPRQPWFKFEDRWNVEKEPNEPNRFGWVVEVDPYDPSSTPVKRTALGRVKHEGATCFVGKGGRVAVYTGDDQRFEYVYKFVSNRPFDPVNAEANRDLLDDGVLSVARFDADGTVRWLPLVHGKGPLGSEYGFRSQADVLIETRRAADLLGATPLDRPEDVEPDPKTGRVYVVLTNNSQRTEELTDGVNSRAKNQWGQIIELIPPGEGTEADHAATTFRWEVLFLAGDPSKPEHGARYPNQTGPEEWLSCPDNVAFDPAGRMWITTDGQDDSAGVADSAYVMELAGPRRGVPRLLYNSPQGAEVCGPCFTPDGTTLFLGIQHPGEERGKSTFDNPNTRWPDFKEGVPPRPSVVAITREDGKPV
jgi:uncharacterized protein